MLATDEAENGRRTGLFGTISPRRPRLTPPEPADMLAGFYV